MTLDSARLLTRAESLCVALSVGLQAAKVSVSSELASEGRPFYRGVVRLAISMCSAAAWVTVCSPYADCATHTPGGRV